MRALTLQWSLLYSTIILTAAYNGNRNSENAINPQRPKIFLENRRDKHSGVHTILPLCSLPLCPTDETLSIARYTASLA